MQEVGIVMGERERRKNTSLDHKGEDLSPKAQSRELAKCQELKPSLQLIPNQIRIRKAFL
jgi:hypothetical protein